MRYRIRRPLWQRLWMRLSKEDQIRIRSCSLSISVNFSVLLILGLCAFSLPHSEAITLILGPSDGDQLTEDTITITPEPEEEEPEEEQPEPEEEEAEPAPIEEPEDDEPPPEDEGEVADPEAGNAVSAPSQLSDLISDADRVSEIERRVATAGGGLEGPIRISVGFSGDDDIDLHLYYEGQGGRGRHSYPVRGHVFYGKPRCHWGRLDVDANAREVTSYPAENIYFAKAPTKGKYTVRLNHYRRRGRAEPTPYVVIVKYGRLKRVFNGNIMPGQTLNIFQFSYRHRT